MERYIRGRLRYDDDDDLQVIKREGGLNAELFSTRLSIAQQCGKSYVSIQYPLLNICITMETGRSEENHLARLDSGARP